MAQHRTSLHRTHIVYGVQKENSIKIASLTGGTQWNCEIHPIRTSQSRLVIVLQVPSFLSLPSGQPIFQPSSALKSEDTAQLHTQKHFKFNASNAFADLQTFRSDHKSSFLCNYTKTRRRAAHTSSSLLSKSAAPHLKGERHYIACEPIYIFADGSRNASHAPSVYISELCLRYQTVAQFMFTHIT